MNPIIAYEARGGMLAKHISMACVRIEDVNRTHGTHVTMCLALGGIEVISGSRDEMVPWSTIAATDGVELYNAIDRATRNAAIPAGTVIDQFGRAKKAKTSDDMNVLALLAVLRLTYESLRSAGQGALVRHVLADDAPEAPCPTARRFSS